MVLKYATEFAVIITFFFSGKSFPEKAADMTLKSIQALTSWRSVKSLILICFVCAIIAKYATGMFQVSGHLNFPSL